LGLVAVILASINMVGGFVVTDRMLVMFSRPKRAIEKSGRRELDK
jgi:proton-translocating NAD(P)+ transhydrogenase subunit alpha